MFNPTAIAPSEVYSSPCSSCGMDVGGPQPSAAQSVRGEKKMLQILTDCYSRLVEELETGFFDKFLAGFAPKKGR